MHTKIFILDTTLRDGEQTSGVAFSGKEKLTLARMLLEEVGVDRLELASAKVSEGELNAVKEVTSWANNKGLLEKIEILGFVDGGDSLQWIQESGAKVMNLLAKGSEKHLRGQLRKSKEQHIDDILRVVDLAESKGIGINLYLEDWSNGMKYSPDHVFYLVEKLQNSSIKRFMLPDTLGVLTPTETWEYCKKMKEAFPSIDFDFHAHNDYDLAVANVVSAVRAGIDCIHTTVNGLGERAGNAILSSVYAVLTDHYAYQLSINESSLYKVSKLVESFSGLRIPPNKPVIGDHVFTQTCGVHADGDAKDNLYVNKLLPERFGRSRKYALGKTSGKANIRQNLLELGIELNDQALRQVTQRVIELGDKKESVTSEDLPYIVADVLDWQTIQPTIKLEHCNLSHAKGLKPVAAIALLIDGKQYEASASGDGQYDAFMKALNHIYTLLGTRLPELIDYSVTIPPGGKTDALVETVITWFLNKEFTTRGIDTDQTFAAIKATEKMLNILANSSDSKHNKSTTFIQATI